MATMSYVSIAPPVFMPSLEPQQDYHLQLKVPALVDSLLKYCDSKDINDNEVASSSPWSSLISLPRQPRTFLESIGTSQSTLRPPVLTNSASTKQPPLPKMQNLELCTEILGSENGVLHPVEDLGNIDQSSAKDVTLQKYCKIATELSDGTKLVASQDLEVMSKRKKRTRAPSEFPPPLTTLGGEDRLRLSTKREDGRLLLLPFVPSLLEAERSQGCLRLRLLPKKSCNPLCRRRKEENDIEEEEEEYFGAVGMEMKKGLVFSGCSNGEYNRRTGRCKEKEEDVARPVLGGVMSRREMLISDAMWVSSS